jgi:Cytochrome c2
MFKKLVFVLIVLTLVLAACGGGGGQQKATPTTSAKGPVKGDATRGEALFKQTTIGQAPGCSTCHSLEPGKKLVGPSLAHVATEAETYVKQGKAASVDEYLHDSIVDPDKFVVKGFPKGIMYQNYGKDLNAQQIADLVAFLKTLK